MKLRNILVPLDGSALAEAALPRAVYLAQRAGATIRLVTVHATAAADAPRLKLSRQALEGDRAVRRGEREYLAEMAARIRGFGVRAGTILLDGPVAETLSAHAEGTEADLVVLSSHGRGAMGRLWLGSVADHLIRHLSMPLLVVRGDAEPVPPKGETPRILVPLDCSERAERALEPAVTLARLMGGELALLHVVVPGLAEPPTAPFPLGLEPQLMETLRESGERYLTGAAERVRGMGVAAAGEVVFAPSVTDGVSTRVRRGDIAAVAIATQAPTGLERLVRGSTTDRLLRESGAPVLVVPPGMAGG